MKRQDLGRAASLKLSPDIRLKKAIELAMAYWAPKQGPNAQRGKRKILDEVIAVYGPMKIVREIDREAIVDLVNHWQRRDVEVYHFLRHVRQFFNLMVEEGVVPVNPVQYRRLPFTIRPAKVKPLIAYEQYRAVLAESIKPNREPFWPTVLMIGWETGLRSVDAATIRWGIQPKGSYVDLENELIVARPTKLEARRQVLEIPITGELLEHLRALHAVRDMDSVYVMPMAAYQFVYGQSGGYFRIKMKQIFIACGMPEHSFHCFRHSFVSRLVKASISPVVIGEMTGQSLATIQRYSRVSNDDKRVALDAIRQGQHAERVKALGYQPPTA